MNILRVLAGAIFIAIGYFAPGIIDVASVNIAGWTFLPNLMSTVFQIIGGWLLIGGLFGGK